MDITHFATLVLRQAEADPSGTATADAAASSSPACESDNDYNGRMGVRISAIFVILVGSMAGECNSWFYLFTVNIFAGAMFPVFARRRTNNRILDLAFFFAKYFGSGVIIATAFIHVSCRSQSIFLYIDNL